VVPIKNKKLGHENVTRKNL